MQIKFYSGFTKRVNSTKQPTTATATLTGELKENCSVENPIIKIENLSPNVLPGYVYAYIPAFSRYYFVSNWVYNPPYWECSMSEDYLASWKTNIGNTNAYIERCSAEYDPYIIDTFYLTNVDTINFTVPIISQYYNVDTDDGCFVLGVIEHSDSSNSQMGGAVTYYALTPAECRGLMSYLTGDQFLTDAGFPSVQSLTQQLSQDTAKILISPMDYITSCMWFPFPRRYFAPDSQATTRINVGYWSVSSSFATGKYVTEEHIKIITGCTIPDHPQITRGKYLNFAPYTRLSILIPPFGLIPIDPAFRSNGDTLRLEINIDVLTGKARLIVNMIDDPTDPDYNRYVICETEGAIGCPVQLAQVRNDMISAGIETFMAGASFLSVGNLFSGGKETVQHAKNALDALLPQVKTGGESGSRLFTKVPPVLNVQQILLSPEDNDERGRPLYDRRVINTLTNGFVKCLEVSVDYPCFDTEKEAIHDFMTNGFYYE